MNRVSRIATSLPDRSVLESIRQTDALLDRYRRMEEMYSRIATSLPDRSVLESIRQTDALLDRYRRMEEMHSRIATSLPDRSVLESIRQTDALLDRYRRMEEMYSRIATSLPDRSVLESIRQTDALLDSARLTAMTLQESPAMRAIREFSNTPFDPVIQETVFNDLDTLEIGQSDIFEYPDSDIDQSIQSEIQRELAGNKDYNGLSNRAKSFLSSTFYIFLLPIFINIVSSLIIIPYLQTYLQEKETLAEIRSCIRKPILGINKELLKNYRIVIGSDVHLRKGPSMKSEIITKLPRRKLIEVLDKSNRSWLRVEVDIEGETFVGWVSRRYTAYFK